MNSRVFAAALLAACCGAVAAVAQPASESTLRANVQVLDSLPFADQRDFEAASRGLIATLGGSPVLNEDGGVAYDFAAFDFLEGPPPDTVNPSLWRQSRLNAIAGLFEVTPGVYQVRGFDLANMSFLRGRTGWIVIDPLTVTATAAAGLALLRAEVEDLPVSAVILTHSHVDHFGGIKGVVTPEDIEVRGVPVIAPQGFFEESVSENLMAGNAMSRRAIYMYGRLLSQGPEGTLGSGLGTTTAAGDVTILPPTIEIAETPTLLEVDGVELVFVNTPGAEAPSELMFYIPEHRAMMQAEIINRTHHNLYTLRGAKVRDGLLWSKYIHDAIRRFGDEVEISFGSHHWPTWGNAEILDFWKGQRDLYRYIHDETLRLANHGATMREIAEQMRLPDSLASQFPNRDYYGTVSHNAKAQYQLYYGWFSGNPSELNPLPPVEEGRKFVDYAGGAEALLEKARADYDRGEYRWVATALNHLVFAEPDNAAARALLADTLTQLGYQAESGPWRNFYLSGALELRHGIPDLAIGSTASPDIVRNLPLELSLDYLGVRLDHPEAAGRDIRLNFVMPDVGERFTLAVENGVLNYTIGEQAADAQATVTIERALLGAIALGEATAESAVAEGRLAIEGDGAKVSEFVALLDDFDLWFGIVTP